MHQRKKEADVGGQTPTTTQQQSSKGSSSTKGKDSKWTTWDIIFLPVYILVEIFSLRPLRNWVRVWVDRYLLLSFVLFFITSWYIEPYIVWQVDFSIYEHSVFLLSRHDLSFLCSALALDLELP